MSAAATASEPRAEAQEGREKNGQFAKGNPFGPGNPYNRQVAAYRAMVLECVTEEKLRAMVNKFMEMAAEGNIAAGRLILPYILGKPAPAPDPDKLDMQEWQGYREAVTMMQELPNLATFPSKHFPLAVARTV